MREAASRLGLSAHKQLTYGISADSNDEYLPIGQSTVHQSLKRCCKAVPEFFGQ